MAQEPDLSAWLQALGRDGNNELYRSLVSILDGPQGSVARVEFYGPRFRHFGGQVTVGCRVDIPHPEWVEVGDRVVIENDVKILARGPGGIRLGNDVVVKSGVYLDTERPEGYIYVDPGSYIGAGSILYGHMGLEIGHHTLIAQQVTITPYSHRFADPDHLISEQGGHTRRVIIGPDCYLGMHSTVLYKADIGQGAVVGAGAVVVDSVPPGAIVVGVPARIIANRRGSSGRE